MHEESNDHPATPESVTPAGGSARSVELQRFWEAVKRLPAYLKLVTAMVRDPEVPNAAKAMLGVGGVYAISPVDLVPGVIPVAGQLDDLYVLLTAIQQAVKRTPSAVAERHLEAAGIRREDIDGDLKSIRDLVRVAVVKTVKFGGKILERASRTAVRFANEQFR
ncbi:MAG TPA: DUF1232 domain-containing protein, partial [Thermomicrobiales bacterium]|nr:DUF1232 domain-containing protein [Thermomicrobiales bacterium]